MTQCYRSFVVALAATLVLHLVPATAQDRVTITQDKGKASFAVSGQPAGTYHTEGFSKPILWPALAPGGVPLTRDWPMGEATPGGSKDHPHHQSIWFCHGDVIPKGMELKLKVKGVDGVDFWSLAINHGKIVCTETRPGAKGSFWASLDTTNEWKTADGVKIMDEKRTVTLYDFGKARLWVFDIDLHASVCPIIFGDTKEGSMAFRVHDEMREKPGNGAIQNAEGKKGEKECWGMKSAWCDYSGTVNGKKVGITVMDDPKNSSPVCYHARSYGLMGANPFGRKKAAFPDAKGKEDLVELAQGNHLVLRYGILIHEGGTEDGNVAEYYQRFLKLSAKR